MLPLNFKVSQSSLKLFDLLRCAEGLWCQFDKMDSTLKKLKIKDLVSEAHEVVLEQ